MIPADPKKPPPRRVAGFPDISPEEALIMMRDARAPDCSEATAEDLLEALFGSIEPNPDTPYGSTFTITVYAGQVRRAKTILRHRKA